MKKTSRVFPIFIGFPFLILSACSSKGASSSDSVQAITLSINADYGVHQEGFVTLLLGDSLLPFSPNDYGIDCLVVGDSVELLYTGEWMVQSTYPSTIVGDLISISAVNVTHGRSVLFEIAQVPGGGYTSKPVDPNAHIGGYSTRNCIEEDGTFQTIDSLGPGTRFYGIVPADKEEGKIAAFYSYDPFI